MTETWQSLMPLSYSWNEGFSPLSEEHA